MIIKNAILHIMDFNSDICVFSQKELDFSDSSVSEYIEKQISKIHKDTGRKNGEFKEESAFLTYFNQYEDKEIEFVEFSKWIGNALHDNITLAEDKHSFDMLVMDYIVDDGNYFGIFLLDNKTAYTHQVINEDGVINNQLIKHQAILPNITQKISTYAVIDKDTKEIFFTDKKLSINGKGVMVIPEILLECNWKFSTNEAVRIVKKVTTEVAEEYGSNSAVAVSKVKNYIVENSETKDSFCPFDLAEEVFSDSQPMKEAFEKKMEDKKLQNDIRIEHTVAVKTSQNHKIKTDTGIEVVIPVKYFEDSKYIEFINNPDGTLSIELKNIGKITNK